VQGGDLGLWVQPRVIVVLEGVIADVHETVTGGRFRKQVTRSFHWLQVPIKRIVYLKDQWPDASIECVTFIDQSAADEASRFFEDAHIPIDTVSYRPLDQWVQEILWQPDIQTVYDSDMDRIMRSGQRGYMVQRGEDFH
jgi:hypothetical protein